jgi:hypothetical protein
MTLVKRMKLSKGNKGHNGQPDGDINVHLPASLGRAVDSAGYTHVDVHLTSAGILLVPTKEAPAEAMPDTITLPDWS